MAIRRIQKRSYLLTRAAQNRRLAKYAFQLARRAKRARRWKEAATATKLGRAALAVARAQRRLWWRRGRLVRTAFALRKKVRGCATRLRA